MSDNELNSGFSSQPVYNLKQANFRSPPGLTRWFTGFCTTLAAPEIGIGVVQKPLSTGMNPVA
jgi:hypothetical protein